MVDSKIFICNSAAEKNAWMENIEERRYKSLRQQLSPSHSTLSYLVHLIQPCTAYLEYTGLIKHGQIYLSLNEHWLCLPKEPDK